MYTLTIQFDTAEDLQAYLDARAAKTAPATTEAKVVKAVKEAIKPKPTETVDEDTLVYADHVQPLVVKLGQTHGKPAALEVLGNFEDEDGNACTKATQVAEGDWPALIKKVKAAQKKLDAAKAAAEDE